jgi:hypothetical protein
MPLVGIQPTTPVFERVKTDHPFDRAATAIGNVIIMRANTKLGR